MMFDEKFLTQLRDDPISSVLVICQRVEMEINDELDYWTNKEYQVLLEAVALIDSAIESELISFDTQTPTVIGNVTDDCKALKFFLNSISQHFTTAAAQQKFSQMKSQFKLTLGGGFSYEFSQGDLTRIQTLVNELREQIASSTLFEGEHQQRLLRRLEKIQTELHKKVSDLDRLWGLIGDAGVVIGKFGNDAKPLVDRIKEIASIVWQTQSRAEELPSGTPVPLLDMSKEKHDDS
ncbi:MAG: hypothetical protein HY254_09285 [Burkholderiales bacterium]|nr:hypothetical protein [Burkholderiales bacterium]